MTVFPLFMFICVTTNFTDGTLMSKSCRWEYTGTLYSTQTACDQQGKSRIGK